MAAIAFWFSIGGESPQIAFIDMVGCLLASTSAVLVSGQHEFEDADSFALYMASSMMFAAMMFAALSMSVAPGM